MFDAKKIKDELIQWVQHYFAENASPGTKAVVGVSGGKDSSVVLALCVAALGKENVIGVLMPQGTQEDIAVAYELCQLYDVSYVEVNIGKCTEELYSEMASAGISLNSVARQNTPARIRMTTLYAVSASVGGRVANTCNLSEDWVGYATKYGDSAGDFSALSHLTVTEVKAVGRELGLLEHFIEKTPIDGLCGLSDEENLGFTYAALDQYIREGVCEDPAVKEKIDRLHRQNLHKLKPMPAFQIN